MNKEVDRLSQVVLYHDGHIADAKAEARKEFAERLIDIGKQEGAYNYVSLWDIDTLLKEME